MASRYRREFRLWGSTPERDADDELRFHIEMRTAELMEAGWTEPEARTEAARTFGNLAEIRAAVRRIDRQTEHRMRITTWLLDLGQDAVSAVRQFRAAPGFTAAAVLTVALGVGATTAIFGIVNAVILRPLPFPEPERIVLVSEFARGQAGEVSPGNFIEWRAATRDVLPHLAAVNYANVNLSGASEPERVVAGLVSRGFFELFGMPPLHGRFLRPDEDRPGHDAVVVLSHALFVRRFAGNPGIVGQTIRLNDRPHIVVGVMPEAFDYLENNEDLWAPIAFTPEREATYDEHYLTVFGRLAPAVTLAQAQDRLVQAAAETERRFPRHNEDISARAVPYSAWLVQDLRARLYTWLGAVGCVLLIACANVANLLLARGTGRARELAVRASLGAGRWRIVRQLLAESLVLAAVGAAAGVILAVWATNLLAAAGPASLPRLSQASLDRVVLAFAIALTVSSALAFGLVPALRAARADLNATLREGGRSGRVVARDRVRTLLVAAEVALAVVLVVGTGLLLRAAWQLQRVSLGFDPSGVLTAQVTLSSGAYASGERAQQAFDRMVSRLMEAPGVRAAGYSSQVPMGPGGNGNGLLPEGRPVSRDNIILARLRIVSPRYLETMRVPVRDGRGFTEHDRRGAPAVMIVSRSLADAAWPGEDPIGKRVFCCGSGSGNPPVKTVVGVVDDVRSSGPAADVAHEFYLPAAQVPEEAWSWIQRTMTLAARTDGDAAALASPIREAVRSVDPTVPVHNLATMHERLSRSLASNRFNVRLIGALGTMALVLAAVGIYSVIAYFASQRLQEIGIRLALGATPASVIALVARQAVVPVGLGLAFGGTGAAFGARFLENQVDGVRAVDPVALAAGVGLLALVAIVASVLPARRAARIQPRLLVDG